MPLDPALSDELLAQTAERNRSFARSFFRGFSWFGLAMGVGLGTVAALSLHDATSWVGFVVGVFAGWIFFGAALGGAVYPFIARDMARVRRLLKRGTIVEATVTDIRAPYPNKRFVHLEWSFDGRPRTLRVTIIEVKEPQLKKEMQVLDDGSRAALLLPGHGLYLAS